MMRQPLDPLLLIGEIYRRRALDVDVLERRKSCNETIRKYASLHDAVKLVHEDVDHS